MDIILVNPLIVKSSPIVLVWETIKSNKYRIGLEYTNVVKFHVPKYYIPIRFVFGGIQNNSEDKFVPVGQSCEIDKLSIQSKSTSNQIRQDQTYCHCQS